MSIGIMVPTTRSGTMTVVPPELKSPCLPRRSRVCASALFLAHGQVVVRATRPHPLHPSLSSALQPPTPHWHLPSPGPLRTVPHLRANPPPRTGAKMPMHLTRTWIRQLKTPPTAKWTKQTKQTTAVQCPPSAPPNLSPATDCALPSLFLSKPALTRAVGGIEYIQLTVRRVRHMMYAQ